jgi:phosphoserine phosphatase RsbU/P
LIASVSLVTAFALIDALSSVSFLGAMVLGPVVAALAARPRHVALVGAYAVTWVLLLGYDSAHWTSSHWMRIAINVMGAMIAVGAAASRERYIAALVKTTDLANVVQSALLRPLAERYDDVELQVRYLSSIDGALVGGDVYDAEVTPWGLRVLVADVCGHGLEAVDRASTIVFSFRDAAHRCATLAEIAREMNDSLRRHRAGEAADFATALLLEVNHGTVKIVNCGHPDPIVVGGQAVRTLTPLQRSTPIGLDPTPHFVSHELQGSDVLLAFTDGVTEARNPQGVFFDLEAHAMKTLHGVDLARGLDELLAAAERHVAGPVRDDLILFAMRRQPA